MLTNRSIPKATVIPVLTYPDVDQAVAWLTTAFGFTLRLTIPGHRAQLNIGDGAMIVRQASLPPTDPALTPDHYIMVRVEDANAHYQHATQHRAQILQPPTDFPYGERQYIAVDLAGHRWTFSQSIANLAPEDWGGESGQLT